jgi:hypothetical protein
MALSWFLAQHSLVGARWRFVLVAALWAVPWLAGAWAAQRIGSRRVALGLILVFTIGLRLAAATGDTPSISSDLYRYGWDAHVQLSGMDPYRYPPNAPQLRGLRSPGWWPSPAGCAQIGKKPGCTTINRANVRTIYPAVAEAWFDVVSLAYPGRSASLPWQLAGGLVDDATVVALIVLVGRTGRDPRQVAWYALSPVPVIELAANGHVDGLALFLLVAALLALQRDRRGLAGMFIGLATMVKLYPAIAGVAALRGGRLRTVVVAAATCVVTEAPHVLVVGAHVLGYLPGYLSEEHYDSGTRFLLLGVVPLHGKAITGLAVLCVVAACAWVVRAGWEPGAALACLLAVVILVATPVQPWYAVSLAGVGAAVGASWLVLPAIAGEVYYATVILDDPHQVGYGRLCYGLALVGIAAFAWARRRTAPPGSRLSSQEGRV